MILIEVPVYETEIQKYYFIRFTAIFHVRVYVLDSNRQISWETSHNVNLLLNFASVRLALLISRYI